MNKLQAGFTMVELIVVIVLLGILASVAIPMYVDMRTQALQANVNGVAAAISSGSAINYAAYISGNTNYKQIKACDNTLLTNLLTSSPIPPANYSYNITAQNNKVPSGPINVGQTINCTIALSPASGNTGAASVSTTFSIIATVAASAGPI